MDILAIFISSFVIGLSGAMMPGPLLTVAIAESARRGFIAGPLLILGHVLLELLLVAALLLGLAEIFAKPSVGNVIAQLGGAVLLYMGYGMARDAYQGKVTLTMPGDSTGEQRETTGGRAGLRLMVTGAVISISNPYWSLWWATIGLGYITLSLKEGPVGLGLFFTGHAMSDIIWYSAVAGAVVAGRKLLSPKLYRAILLVCGIFLTFLGGMFIFRGFTGV